MGYYVRIEETASNFKIKKENFERGYEIVCDLNRHDYLKHGGKFSGDPTPKPADSVSREELISILLDDLMVVARDNLSIEYLENGGDEEKALKSFNVEMRKNLEKRIIA